MYMNISESYDFELFKRLNLKSVSLINSVHGMFILFCYSTVGKMSCINIQSDSFDFISLFNRVIKPIYFQNN